MPLQPTVDGFQDLVGLVTMRRVATMSQKLQLDVRRVLCNPAHLLHRTVLVVFSLDHQDGATDGRQEVFNVPRPEVRIQPDVVPTTEYTVDIGVMTCEALTQITCVEGHSGRSDARDREILYKHVRGECNDPANRVTACMNERYRAAVAVAE